MIHTVTYGSPGTAMMSFTTQFSREKIVATVDYIRRPFMQMDEARHAADGTGLNDIGRFLDPHPPDLTNAEARRALTEVRLRRAITRGLDGASMPAFGAVLDDGEIDALITYMRRAFMARRDGDR